MKLYKTTAGHFYALTINPARIEQGQKFFYTFIWEARTWKPGPQFTKPEARALEKLKVFQEIHPAGELTHAQAVELLEKIQGLYSIYEYDQAEAAKKRKAKKAKK